MNEELEWMGGAGHSHPTPARGQWDSGSQGKVGDVGNASETAINPSVAAGNAGITGRQAGMEPSAPGEALEHHRLWVGKRRRGAEMQPGREILPSCRPWQQPPSQLQPRWIIPAWHTGFFYFPNEKARLDLKHL